MVVQCCQCKKVRVSALNDAQSRWVDIRRAELNPLDVSHGYCPSCARIAFEEINALVRPPQLAVNA